MTTYQERILQSVSADNTGVDEISIHDADVEFRLNIYHEIGYSELTHLLVSETTRGNQIGASVVQSCLDASAQLGFSTMKASIGLTNEATDSRPPLEEAASDPTWKLLERFSPTSQRLTPSGTGDGWMVEASYALPASHGQSDASE